MPRPFPAQSGTLRPLLEQEGWKELRSGRLPGTEYTVSWWRRGKHEVMLAEFTGAADTLWLPVGEPKRLATTIARRSSRPTPTLKLEK